MLERLKHVPPAIWIGAAFVLIIIFFMNTSKSTVPQTTPGPVTANTVGSSGAQAGAGTDQQLGNLSQLTQGGIAEILRNQKAMQDQLAVLQSGQQTGARQEVTFGSNDPNANAPIPAGIGGLGTPMQQFGAGIQSWQIQSAKDYAVFGANGQPVDNHSNALASGPA